MQQAVDWAVRYGYVRGSTANEWRRSWANVDPATQWWVQATCVLVALVIVAVVGLRLARWVVLRRGRARMQGRVVLVTGGANGLGYALVRKLHALGAILAVWDVDAAGLQRLEQELKERIHTYLVDLTNKRAIYDVAKEVHNDLGRVDILINNAGVVSGKPILETTDEEIVRTLSVNTLALFWTVKAFLPAMKQRNSGHIVNIGSVLGTFGGARLTDYSASKFAVFGFSECLRMELKSEGSAVTTTLVCPYHIDTGMFDGVKIPWYSKLLFPVLKQARVAERIVEAMLLKEEVIMIGSSFWLIFVLRLLPTPLLDRIAHLMGAFTGMQSFVGRAKRD